MRRGKQLLMKRNFLSEKFGMTVRVNYAHQYCWFVSPDTNVEELKTHKVILEM
jgi:hypothetical protein